MISELLGSGNNKQDSNIMMLLMRREYYDPYDKPEHAEVIVAKNRYGQVGSIEMT